MAGTPNSLITPQQVKSSYVLVTNAKTNRAVNDSNNQLLISSSTVPNGALVKRVYAISRETVNTEFSAHLYRSKDSTLFYADNVIIPAGAVGPNSIAVKAEFEYTPDNPMRLAAGEELWAAIGAVGNVIFVAEYEAF